MMVLGSVTSVTPWLLTVAASSTDRRIIEKVVLGNGSTFVGDSMNSFTLNGTSFPLTYGGESAASGQCSEFDVMSCTCLDGNLVKGKIVLCDAYFGGGVAYKDGAEGLIFNINQDDYDVILPRPGIILKANEYDAIKSWRKRSEAMRDDTAPVVVSFSSRGPNQILPNIIKPDISAPGVNILAAYSPIASVTENPWETRHVKYNILSGTSMSSPHAAGAAAYVKAYHPDWSPAAIKSALMTTSWPMNATDDSPGEFAYGSRHINHVRAIDPGLVNEAGMEAYIKELCTVLGEAEIRLISGDNTSCSSHLDKDLPVHCHNCPSLAAVVSPKQAFTVKFRRTVKNVGLANSTYKARIFANSTQVDIKVVPEVLSFNSLDEKKSFDVTIVGEGLSEGAQLHVSALLIWSDGS